MDFHVITSRGVALIHTDENDMPKYEKPGDRAAVDAKRRDDMITGRALVPHGKCHFCDFTVGKGPLWCSTGCANEYAAERKALISRQP